MKEETGLRLKNTRKLLNIRQKELAASLGITATSLSAYEKGKKMPHIEFLLNYASKYGVSIDYIMVGKGEPLTRKVDAAGNNRIDSDLSDLSEDQKEILWYMKNSESMMNKLKLTLKEYLFAKKEFIEEDIKQTREKKQKEKPNVPGR
jgi:transcriptional regulator with XRE-family HTH domain